VQDSIQKMRLQNKPNIHFCFDTEQDGLRAAVVSNSVVGRGEIVATLESATVVVILVGCYTNGSRIQQTIRQSLDRKKALLVIGVGNIKSVAGQVDFAGANPLNEYEIFDNRFGYARRASDIYEYHDWVIGSGYQKLSGWIIKAQQIATSLYAGNAQKLTHGGKK